MNVVNVEIPAVSSVLFPIEIDKNRNIIVFFFGVADAAGVLHISDVEDPVNVKIPGISAVRLFHTGLQGSRNGVVERSANRTFSVVSVFVLSDIPLRRSADRAGLRGFAGRRRPFVTERFSFRLTAGTFCGRSAGRLRKTVSVRRCLFYRLRIFGFFGRFLLGFCRFFRRGVGFSGSFLFGRCLFSRRDFAFFRVSYLLLGFCRGFFLGFFGR